MLIKAEREQFFKLDSNNQNQNQSTLIESNYNNYNLSNGKMNLAKNE